MVVVVVVESERRSDEPGSKLERVDVDGGWGGGGGVECGWGG